MMVTSDRFQRLLASVDRTMHGLVVDDAHGLGVIGATGRGTVEHFGLDAEAVPVLVARWARRSDHLVRLSPARLS